MPVRARVVAVVLVLGLAVGLAASVVVAEATGPRSSAGVAGGRVAAVRPTDKAALAVLHAWDARRADAWAAGDPVALARLYTDRSAAGRADIALLQRYAARGLVVRDLRIQVLRARVLTSRPGRVALEVTDRLSSAVAVRAGDGHASRRLPVDSATTRLLVLRRVDGRWLMARVSAVPPSGGAAGR